MFAIAGAMAAAGFAVVAIDLPLHGLTDPTNPFFRNQLLTGTPGAGLITGERTFNMDLQNNTTGAPGPDGKIDPSGTYFINLSSLLTSRDNLREGIADLLELRTSIATMSLDGHTPGFDTARVAYIGQSLGSIEGTTFMVRKICLTVAWLLPALATAADAPADKAPSTWADPATAAAEIKPLAAKSLLLDVARSGTRYVAVGARGDVLLSDDGRDWRQAEVPTRATLTAVSAVDANVWAVGHDGMLAAMIFLPALCRWLLRPREKT